MATANDLISRALRLIGVVDSNQAMDAVQAQDALGTLNAMLAEWHYADIGLPMYSFTSLSDALASDVADSEAISCQLALRLAPEYGLMPSPALVGMAEQAMGRIRLRYFQPGKVNFDELPGAQQGFNIVTGDV